MPENLERYNEQEALEEASGMQQMVKSGEASSYSEAEKILGGSFESEITPELRNRVLEKIDDIDKPGVAYHVTKGAPELPELKSIFETGLVTYDITDQVYERIRTHKDLAALPQEIRKWSAKSIKRSGKLRGALWFNIVGRARDIDKQPDSTPEIEQMGLYHNEGQMAILFNIDDFTEQERSDRNLELQRKRYAYNPQRREHELDQEQPDSAYGFILSDRISPRKFQGVVLRTHSRLNVGEGDQPGTIWPNKLNEIVKTMLDANKDHPERMVPIYDELGNLLWPDKLTRESIKQLVLQHQENKPTTKEI